MEKGLHLLHTLTRGEGVLGIYAIDTNGLPLTKERSQ
jgi:hypothetical protein